MQRRLLFLFLLVLFPCGAWAECVSVDEITKCARIPEYVSVIWMTRGWYTDSLWSIIYNDVVFSGDGAECVGAGSSGSLCRCEVDSPFDATFLFSTGPMHFDSAYQACAQMLNGEQMQGYTFNARLVNDMCPDGFYTVPYEVSCGEGLVDVTDVPQCDVDTSGDFCLIGELPVMPCAAGVTTLRTTAGVFVPLWAEKSTEPSLCVEYGNTVCYGNLEAGRAVGAININYNGVVYHAVD